MRRQLFGMALLGLVAIFTFACETARGGGWIPSILDPTAKATYGFQLVCNAKKNSVQGQLTYHDHGSNAAFPGGVDIHGEVPKIDLSTVPTTCAQLDIGSPPNITQFQGQYRPQGVGNCDAQPSECGMFTVFVADETFCPVPGEDAWAISLSGGRYDGYFNGNCVQGANVTVFN